VLTVSALPQNSDRREERVRRPLRGLAIVVATCIVFGAVTSAASARLDGGNRLAVEIRDECDPATFNAVLGEGACVGDGTVTFSDFIAELSATQQVETWRFDPDSGGVDTGEKILAKNVGGETHTFTEVAEFGPGIVPELNELVFGVPGPPLPEFQSLGPEDFIAPGGSVKLRTGKHGLDAGVHRFECAIHPWMQATVMVEPKH
jgi:plastocyanin